MDVSCIEIDETFPAILSALAHVKQDPSNTTKFGGSLQGFIEAIERKRTGCKQLLGVRR